MIISNPYSPLSLERIIESIIDNIYNPKAAKIIMYDIFLGQIKITAKKTSVGIVEKILSTNGAGAPNPIASIPIMTITLEILNILFIFFSPLYQFNLLDSKNSKKTMSMQAYRNK